MKDKQSFFNSITGRLLPAFLLVALIPTVMFTFTVFFAVKNIMVNHTRQMTSEQFSLIDSFLSDMIISTALELSVIRDHDSFTQFISSEENLDNVKTNFESAMIRHPEYLQLRFLNSRGMEKLRLNRRQQNLQWVANEDLQDKSDYYYVDQALNTQLNETYVSDLDLNVEHNKVETPWRLVARIGIKVYDKQELCGILLVNMDGNYILSKILPFAGNRADKAFLMNSKGQYIGYDGSNFYVNEPEILNKKLQINSETIFSAPSKELTKTGNGYLSVMPINFHTEQTGNTWRVVLTYANNEIFGPMASTIQKLLIAVITILGVAAVFSMTVSSKITRFIKDIILFIPEASDRPFKPTGVKEFDEIGLEMNKMATGLRTTTTKLASLNNNLEERIEKNIKQISGMAQKQVQYEKELRDMHTQLIHADRLASLGLISASLAQELEIPLASIYDSLRTLQAETGNERIAEIISQMQNLTDFLNKITKFNGRETRKQKLMNIHTILSEVKNFLAVEMDKNNIRFNIINRGDYDLFCDETEIRQIIFNIAINSIQELKNGGEIFAETSITEDTPTLHIYDSGKGAADTEQLFNPFYTTKKGNTGLGLTIVKDLVEKNRWEISLENIPNQGLGVLVTFPENNEQ